MRKAVLDWDSDTLDGFCLGLQVYFFLLAHDKTSPLNLVGIDIPYHSFFDFVDAFVEQEDVSSTLWHFLETLAVHCPELVMEWFQSVSVESLGFCTHRLTVPPSNVIETMCKPPVIVIPSLLTLSVMDRLHDSVVSLLARDFNVWSCADDTRVVSFPVCGKQMACISSSFFSLPRILTLEINRSTVEVFDYPIGFVEVLNAKNMFYASMGMGDCMYELISVVARSGMNVVDGHFVAFVKDVASGRWRMCDDEVVTEVEVGTVLRCGSERGFRDRSGKGLMATVLMYIKSDVRQDFVDCEVAVNKRNKKLESIVKRKIEYRMKSVPSVTCLAATAVDTTVDDGDVIAVKKLSSKKKRNIVVSIVGADDIRNAGREHSVAGHACRAARCSTVDQRQTCVVVDTKKK